MSTNHLKVCIDSFNDEAGFIAWVDNDKLKGIVVQSSSVEGVLKELLISLQVKIAYDYGIQISGLEEKLHQMMKEPVSIGHDGKKEINFMFA